MSGDRTGRVTRRLAAILVAGYSRLLPGDEIASFAGLTALLNDIVEPNLSEFGGNIFKRTGEGVLIEFGSVVEAARCAGALRAAAVQRNRDLLPEERIALRIGINLGDVVVDEGDMFGDGVNIAARLEGLADPGSIFVSAIVHDQVAGKIDFEFVDLGPRILKNIGRPVQVYRMSGAVDEASAGTQAPAAVPGFDDRRAIAVLPFANLSGDPEQEFFADGITEDIITMLSGWRAFPVIARNSTFTYKSQTVDITKVAHELGVRYVLEGSVRKSGRRVRVTAQLIRADTGHHMMAERYDRDLTDLFELQDEIATTIAAAIEPELLKFERNRIAEQPQQSQDAYESYQRGMWHHYRHNKEDNAAAQEMFRRALTLDPNYPQATAALAIAVCNAGYLGWAADAEQNYEEAYRLGERAVALDGRYPIARFALALTCMYSHRAERATAEMRQAIDLNPSFAAAHAILGHMLTYAGRPGETIPLVEKALRLSPNDPRLFIWLPALAAAHYLLGHYEQAVDTGRRSWTLNRNWPIGLIYVAAAAARLGRMTEARAALASYNELRETGMAGWETLARRLFSNAAAVDDILDGLRKAGLE